MRVIVTGHFDNLRAPQMRFFHEASRLGPVTALVWSDEAVQTLTGSPPQFPLAERLYFLRAVRHIHEALPVHGPVDPDALPAGWGEGPVTWAVVEADDSPAKQSWSEARGLGYHVIRTAALDGFPPIENLEPDSGGTKVIVTGCYDWLHSGHVRFFEEASGYGELYVVVGNDANVRMLKGAGHPLFPEDLRQYMAQSIRYVHRCLVSTGMGWMDAAPQIEAIQPQLYVVNEDGDKPEKRAFCSEHDMQYLVLKRTPAAGLPARQSTDLRGF